MEELMMNHALHAVLSTLFMATLLLAPASRAQPVALTCPGTLRVNYAPGLSNTPRLITVDSKALYGPCTGLPLGLVSASLDTFAQTPLSCGLLENGNLSLTLKWNDGTYSTGQGRALLRAAPLGEVVIATESTVTEGRFVGATVVVTSTLLQTDFLACSTPQGVTSVAGPSVLVITRLF
ncbi:hypothetical protein OWM54_33795 [Myxococcus sp. MISCRS1]|jgi:hypothetical protein|uniref:hypothetical protein n=1 Tax=Myxococcus TaxID=32 RepID=UPI00114214F5|nr:MULTISPECIES: hypothetical protein [unclassified Myxococcus]MBZ4398679.1 hypothetical protein [Myxococcus sp. AS-1-15]MCY1002137.1 hypothetical protein [Myxococcus sp. MISCRS1]BDT36290.1 hypothetical protein MFMH1_59590 [Myxococcus sp. MH1]